MTSAVRLGAKLAPRVQAWAVSAAGVGGLTATDVAAAMAGAAPEGERLFRLVAAGDLSGLADVERWLYVRIIEQAAREDWRAQPSRLGEAKVRRGDDLIRRMVRMALDELVTGRRLSGEARAEALGVDRRNWQRVWRGRYAVVDAEIGRQIGAVCKRVSERLGDG